MKKSLHKTLNTVLCMICSLLLLLIIVLPIKVNAAGSATLSASTAECKQGGTATVTVSISGNPGIAGLIITPQSNTSGITFSGASNGSVLGTMTTGSNLVFDAASDSRTNGTLCTVSFNVAANVAPGTYNVSFIARGCSNAAGESISVSNATGTIKVTCASHNYNGWSTVSNATCTAGGREQRSCSACGAVETRDTSTPGHSWGSFSETKAPTCTANGTQTRTCSRCNQSENKSMKATGHSYDKLKETKAPTCTETGEKTGTCKTCDEKVTETIKATGHKFGDWQEVTAPTFSKAGLEKRICSECKVEEAREIEALGYEFSEPTSAKDSVFVYYDITTALDQNALSAKGYVNAKFAVPSGVGSDMKLYFVTDGGVLEEVAATVSEDGSSIEAQLTRLGTYAVCKILDGDSDIKVEDIPDAKDNTLSNNEIKPNKSSLNWIWIVIAGVEFLAIIGYVVYMIWKKKSDK